MSRHFRLIYIAFIDIVYKNIVFLAINLIVYDWKPDKLEVGTNLMEAPSLRSDLDKAYLPEFWVGTCFEGFVFGLGGVGSWDDRLANIDLAGLVFAEPVERLIDHSRFGGSTMNKGEIGLMNLTTLLHFSEQGGVFFASGN